MSNSKNFPYTDYKINNKMSLRTEEYTKSTLEEIKNSKNIIDQIIENEYRNCLKIETEEFLNSLDLKTNCQLKDVEILKEKLNHLANLADHQIDEAYSYKQCQLEAALNANYFLSDSIKFENWISDRINRINLENSRGVVEKDVILEILEDCQEAEANFNTVMKVGDVLLAPCNSSKSQRKSAKSGNSVSSSSTDSGNNSGNQSNDQNKAPIDYLTCKIDFISEYNKLLSNWKTLKNTCDHFLKLSEFREQLMQVTNVFENYWNEDWSRECAFSYEIVLQGQELDIGYWVWVGLKNNHFLLTFKFKLSLNFDGT